MDKVVKNPNMLKQRKLILVVVAFALIGVGALGTSHTKHGVAAIGAGNASINGVSSCVNGVWTVNVNSMSNVAVLLPVDIAHTLSNPSGFAVLASNVYLNRGVASSFQYSPQAGTRTDTLYIVQHGGTPTREATLATTSVTNPCM